MKLFFLGCCILMLLGTHSKAEVSYGIKIGGEVTHLWTTDFDLSTPKLGLLGGGFLKVKFLDLFAVQPEILFVKKGGSYSESSSGTVYSLGVPTEIPLNISRITQYRTIEMPLLFKLYAPGFVTASPHLLIGPYFGYMVGERKIEVSVAGLINSNQPVAKSDFVSQIEYEAMVDKFKEKGIDNKSEYGFVIGGGIDFSLGTFDIRYSFSLSEIEKTAHPEKELDNYHTGTLTVLVGFEF